MACKRVLVLVTGGTFDKSYNLIEGKLFFDNTHLPEIFRRGRSKVDTTVRTLMMIDSLDMSVQDRELIAHHCKRSSFQHIIITHGTDTMVETARVIAEAGIQDKTIVLTGALIPYEFGMSSDGFFNLGSALAFAQTLNPGVYIAMHGCYFDWDNVQKNRSTGYFEAVKAQNREEEGMTD